ncbi:23739_t:CDS:2, partial [Cetraspora pellucida]
MLQFLFKHSNSTIDKSPKKFENSQMIAQNSHDFETIKKFEPSKTSIKKFETS